MVYTNPLETTIVPKGQPGETLNHDDRHERMHKSFNERPIILGDTDFPADLTGATDSTTAVQAAVNAVRDGNAIEVPPQAKIRLDSTVDLGSATVSTRRNFRMYSTGGHGRNEGSPGFQPVFFMPTASGTMFKLDGFAAGSNVQWGPTFEGLTFRDTSNAGAGESVTLFDLIMTNRFTFRDCAFGFALRAFNLDSKEDSFAGGDSAWGLFDNCNWYQCGRGIFSRHTYGHEIRGGAAYRCGSIGGDDLAGCFLDIDAFSQHWRVNNIKIDCHRSGVAAFIGIRDLGSTNEYIAVHVEKAVKGFLMDGDTGVFPSPPSGHHRSLIAPSVVGDGTGTGIELTPNSGHTTIIGRDVQNVATKVLDNSPNGALIADLDNNLKIGRTHATPGTPSKGVVLYVDSSGNLLAKTEAGNVRTVAAV